MKKNDYENFRIPTIWHILKHFSGTFLQLLTFSVFNNSEVVLQAYFLASSIEQLHSKISIFST